MTSRSRPWQRLEAAEVDEYGKRFGGMELDESVDDAKELTVIDELDEAGDGGEGKEKDEE